MKFWFGDIVIDVPDYYLDEIEDLAWLWGHTDLAEKLLDSEDVTDISREEFIQLSEILYSLVR